MSKTENQVQPDSGVNGAGNKKIRIRTFLLQQLVVILLVTAEWFLLRGFPMGKIPKTEEVELVEITDLALGVEKKEITDPEDIELAVKTCNLLAWKPGKPDQTAPNQAAPDQTTVNQTATGQTAPDPAAPEIELVFHLKDGSTITFGANKTTAWRDGKAYRLKEDNNMFVNCVRGIFLQAEAVNLEGKAR